MSNVMNTSEVLRLVRSAARELAGLPDAIKAQLPERFDNMIQIDAQSARGILRARLEEGLERGLNVNEALFDLSSRCLVVFRQLEGEEPSDLGLDDLALLTARLQEADEWRQHGLSVPWSP
jgi:hypothetical protein